MTAEMIRILALVAVFAAVLLGVEVALSSSAASRG